MEPKEYYDALIRKWGINTSVNGTILNIYRKRKKPGDQLFCSFFVRIEGDSCIITYHQYWDKFAYLIIDYVVNELKAPNIEVERRLW